MYDAFKIYFNAIYFYFLNFNSLFNLLRYTYSVLPLFVACPAFACSTYNVITKSTKVSNNSRGLCESTYFTNNWYISWLFGIV
jgi:hypothetical protein